MGKSSIIQKLSIAMFDYAGFPQGKLDPQMAYFIQEN
jgi:hypothetical protein